MVNMSVQKRLQRKWKKLLLAWQQLAIQQEKEVQMNRTEARRLINQLLDPNTEMDDKQLAAARLTELIKLLLPE